MKSVIGGIAAGTLAAGMAFRLTTAALVDVRPPSVVMWGADVALVTAMCAVAAALPAYRVIGIRPMAALSAA